MSIGQITEENIYYPLTLNDGTSCNGNLGSKEIDR